MAPPDHQQLGMARANVFFEASLFSSATGGDVRPPHMRINDVVGTGFARLPIGCPADPPALARLVQVNLDRSVLADRLFVDPIYEHHPCACAFYFDPPRFSTGASTTDRKSTRLNSSH